MRRELDEPRLQRLDADERHPQRAEVGECRHCDGACTDDERDDTVEIVVIPIAPDPRRVRRLCVGGRHQPEKGGNEEKCYVPLKHAT